MTTDFGHTWARRSSTGFIMRQGPHQLALKSSSTALSMAACTGARIRSAHTPSSAVQNSHSSGGVGYFQHTTTYRGRSLSLQPSVPQPLV